MIPIIILSAILLALVAGCFAIYRHSRSPGWVDSDVRLAAMRVFMAVGPMLGVRYKPPRPELPAVTTPGPDTEPLPAEIGDKPD